MEVLLAIGRVREVVNQLHRIEDDIVLQQVKEEGLVAC